jgi:dTDP-4-dehydrorhamnose 3,5-epimerase
MAERLAETNRLNHSGGAMELEPLPLGTFRLVPALVHDVRGFFARCYSRSELDAAGLVTDFPEWSLSYNARRGTLRGLHWQAAPYFEAKLVQCTRGAVFDVVVDIRGGSSTRGQWHAVELSAENRHILYIPKGFAHGFQTLTDDAEILYHISEVFRPEFARGLHWSDPTVAIRWPVIDKRILSDRDAALPSLAELDEST